MQENKKKGFVKIFKSFLDWEWYENPNVKIVFIHCLLRANWKDKRYEGIVVKRGTFTSSITAFSRDLSMGESKIKTALKKLVDTKEITIKATNTHSTITVCNYDGYQDKKDEDSKRNANESQTDSKPIANESQTDSKPIATTIEVKNKKDKERKRKNCEFEKAWILYGRRGTKKTALDQWNKKTTKECKKIIKSIPFYILEVSTVSYRLHFFRYIRDDAALDVLERAENPNNNNKTTTNNKTNTTTKHTPSRELEKWEKTIMVNVREPMERLFKKMDENQVLHLVTEINTWRDKAIATLPKEDQKRVKANILTNGKFHHDYFFWIAKTAQDWKTKLGWTPNLTTFGVTSKHFLGYAQKLVDDYGYFKLQCKEI